MRRILSLSVLSLAAGAVACEPEHVRPTETPPTAGVRFVHAAPDFATVDFRFVDLVENSAHYAFSFRHTANLYYKPARAGQRHLRIFLNGTTAEVASTVVKDTVVTLTADQRYTFILWGFSTGQNPAMRLTVIEDNPADPGTQVALRVIHAAAGLGALDVAQYPSGGAPGAATWTSVAELSASNYITIAPSQTRYHVTPAGGGAQIADALALAGAAATVDADAVPGTNVAGSAVSGIIVPQSVPESDAASFASPGIIFVWDRRPPRTCSPIC